MTRIGLSLVIPFCIAASLASAVAAPWDSCLTRTVPEDKVRCVEEKLPAQTGKRLDGIERLIDHDPATALAVVESWRGEAGEDDTGLAAELWELQGKALSELGRHAEAAEAFTRAQSLDDGTLDLSWLPAGEVPASETALGPGAGRLERTARSLLAAGRADEARTLLARVLALGAAGWPNEAWQDLGGGAVPGLDPSPSQLSSTVWRAEMPPMTVPMYGGKEFSLAGSRGRVVILDFWASWCAPCVRELPFLDELYAAHRERGLDIVAVNFQEAPDTAFAFAQSLGLGLPVGICTLEMERHFKIESMPTVIVADRTGRIRARWGGYEDGIARELTELVELLLDEKEEPSVELAQVVWGSGLLEVDWTRRARREVEGVAIVPDVEGRPRVIGALARSLDAFHADGELDRSFPTPTGMGTLRPVDVPGAAEVISFRPGAKQVTEFRVAEQSYATWEVPAPVFAVSVVPSSAPDGAPTMLFGTLDGLFRATGPGTFEPVGEFGAVSGLVWDPGTTRLLVLEAGERVSTLSQALEPVADVEVALDSWVLVGGSERIGVAPAGVTDVAVGRFLPGDGRQAALALDSGQLVLVEIGAGTVRFRAEWEGIARLGAGDLDGDGWDELAVASGRTLAVLECGPCRDSIHADSAKK